MSESVIPTSTVDEFKVLFAGYAPDPAPWEYGSVGLRAPRRPCRSWDEAVTEERFPHAPQSYARPSARRQPCAMEPQCWHTHATSPRRSHAR
jgi:hypothetical protein